MGLMLIDQKVPSQFPRINHAADQTRTRCTSAKVRLLVSQPSICPRQKDAAASSSGFLESLAAPLSDAAALWGASSEALVATLFSASAVGTDVLAAWIGVSPASADG